MRRQTMKMRAAMRAMTRAMKMKVVMLTKTMCR